MSNYHDAATTPGHLTKSPANLPHPLDMEQTLPPPFLDGHRVRALVEEDAGEPHQGVQPRVDLMVLLNARHQGLVAGLAGDRPALALLILEHRLADLLHLLVLRRDLRRKRLASCNPVGRQLVRLLGQLRMPRLERLLLGPFARAVGIQAGDSLLEAGFRRRAMPPRKPPRRPGCRERSPVPGP